MHKLEHSRTIQQTISGTRLAMPPMCPHFLTALCRDHMAAPPTTTPHTPAINPNPTVPPTSALMDVDATRTHQQARAYPSNVCCWCKKLGHWAHNCPMCYDMRHMTFEEIEGCYALAQDGVPLEQHGEPETQTDKWEVMVQEELGFGTASG